MMSMLYRAESMYRFFSISISLYQLASGVFFHSSWRRRRMMIGPAAAILLTSRCIPLRSSDNELASSVSLGSMTAGSLIEEAADV